MNNVIKALSLDCNSNISHTKIFSGIGYIVLIVAFIYHTITNIPIDLNLWTIFSGVVIFNRTINKKMELKTRNDDNEQRINGQPSDR